MHVAQVTVPPASPMFVRAFLVVTSPPTPCHPMAVGMPRVTVTGPTLLLAMRVAVILARHRRSDGGGGSMVTAPAPTCVCVRERERERE